ncbi:MAG: sensor histidine kinase [Jatrophihabitans sp.]|uniref:sensor histidine kinase n=1 Tax=Jatrophihabitans sp. TaxID=1932789 RepID=UPI003F814BCD
MRDGDPSDGPPTVAFADVPKLELDQLIDQLVASAEGVKRAQGRLRVLLRAVEMVNADLTLETALGHLASAARYVADAGRAAIIVLTDDGSIAEAAAITAAGELRRVGARVVPAGTIGDAVGAGRSLRLVADGERFDVRALLDDPTPATSLLTAPVRVRGAVFGQLVVLDSTHGEFTAEDEQLLHLLATAAGTTLDNARLYAESRSNARWLRATADVTAQLLSDTGEDPLRSVARHVRQVADAETVTVSLLTQDGEHVVIEVVEGPSDEDLVGRRLPLVGSFTATALAERRPVIVRTGARPGSALVDELLTSIDAGPMVIVPLLGTSDPLGAIGLIRPNGAPAFTRIDLDAVEQFANQAALALELATARADRQRIELLEDRDRIARDLHDHVIQQLFAIGLSLQGLTAGSVDNPELTDALEDKVESIDRTIRQIRTTIFALRNPGGSQAGLRSDLLAIGSELTPTLGFSPGFTFAGAVDTMLGQAVADDIRTVVHEALVNVARHARARRAFVDVTTDNVSVTVRVTDDGVGMAADVSRHGLLHLSELAHRRGGSLEVQSLPTGGTELIWKAHTS